MVIPGVVLQQGADAELARDHYDGIKAHVDFLARQAKYGGGVPQFGPYPPSPVQKGTRVLVSLWDSLMFGRVPRPAAPGQYKRVLEYSSRYGIR